MWYLYMCVCNSNYVLTILSKRANVTVCVCVWERVCVCVWVGVLVLVIKVTGTVATKSVLQVHSPRSELGTFGIFEFFQ